MSLSQSNALVVIAKSTDQTVTTIYLRLSEALELRDFPGFERIDPSPLPRAAKLVLWRSGRIRKALCAVPARKRNDPSGEGLRQISQSRRDCMYDVYKHLLRPDLRLTTPRGNELPEKALKKHWRLARREQEVSQAEAAEIDRSGFCVTRVRKYATQ